jgi:hypothetical protein
MAIPPIGISIKKERRIKKMKKYFCACCGYKTVEGHGDYDICPICHWEDDPVQGKDPDYKIGANKVSLKDAKRNFQEFGASDERFTDRTRKPKKDEKRDPDWKMYL